jgi:hypothetical protein
MFPDRQKLMTYALMAAFEHGKLTALDELRGRFCVCMK